MISLGKRRVWLVVDYAPTCPRRCNFWGNEFENLKRYARAPHIDVTSWAIPPCLPAQKRSATASPKGKYIFVAVGRARATPPIPICVCNLPIFFIFFGYYRNYCCLSRVYTICNTLGLPFRHKNTPLSNPKGGSVNNYIYNRAGYSLSIQSKNGFVNVFF